MALVSVKNFVTPFTNRVHLGTIILVVVVFAVFSAADGRLSLSLPNRPKAGVDQNYDSGKRSAQPVKHQLPDAPSTMDELDPTQELSRLGIEPDQQPAAAAQQRQHAAAPRGQQQPAAQNGDLLDSMIGHKNAGKDPQGGKNQGDLDEVERRLGLR